MTDGIGAGSTVLVTGADGFVGRHLCAELTARGYRVRGLVRRLDAAAPAHDLEYRAIGDLREFPDWNSVLLGVDAVCHLAAKVHDMRAAGPDASRDYFKVNSEVTLRLAEAAVATGVRRFLFLSSIKVNGEASGDTPFRADDAPHPEGPYAESKLRAEAGLLALGGPMRVLIVRPPLVYGPGVRANFRRLLQMVHRGVPLPVGALSSRRSLVSVWNLVDLLTTMLAHQGAPARPYLVSDADDVSTPQLLRLIADAMGRPLRIWSCPLAILTAAAKLAGRAEDLRRLSEPLQVDIDATCRTFDWAPPVPLPVAIERTVSAYLERERHHA